MYKDNNISGASQESKTTATLLKNTCTLLILCAVGRSIVKSKATRQPLKYIII